jgi:hypothetical protein
MPILDNRTYEDFLPFLLEVFSFGCSVAAATTFGNAELDTLYI